LVVFSLDFGTFVEKALLGLDLWLDLDLNLDLWLLDLLMSELSNLRNLLLPRLSLLIMTKTLRDEPLDLFELG